MAKLNLKKGHNLKIDGEPIKILSKTILSENVYFHPKDFPGIKPRLLVEKGDSVLVGIPIFFDKALIWTTLKREFISFGSLPNRSISSAAKLSNSIFPDKLDNLL